METILHAVQRALAQSVQAGPEHHLAVVEHAGALSVVPGDGAVGDHLVAGVELVPVDRRLQRPEHPAASVLRDVLQLRPEVHNILESGLRTLNCQ